MVLDNPGYLSDSRSTYPEVEFVRLCPTAILPTKAYREDSGFDLYATQTVTLQPLKRDVISTGWKIGIPTGWEGQVRSRSGNAIKKGIFVLNSPGTIDAGYRGELCVIMFNTNSMPVTVYAGDRIAQIVFTEVPTVSVKEVSNFTEETDRGENGFGSTGLAGQKPA